MKKTCLLLIAVLIGIAAARAQNAWINYKIDNKLSVKLPGQPEKYGQSSHKVSTKDSTVCIVSLIDLKATTQLDSAAIVALLPTADFEAGLKASMFGQMEGFVMGDVKTGKWNGNYSYAFEGGNTAKKVKTYTFMVVVGCNLYALNCLVPDGNNIKTKDDFFASLKMN